MELISISLDGALGRVAVELKVLGLLDIDHVTA
jgi:hypothetical protein